MFLSASEQFLKSLNSKSHPENKSPNSRQNKLCFHLINHGGTETNNPEQDKNGQLTRLTQYKLTALEGFLQHHSKNEIRPE